MKRLNFTKIITYLTEFILLLLVFLLPICFSLFTNDNFELIKTFVFRIFLLILLLLSVIKFLSGEYLGFFIFKYYKKLFPALIFLLIFSLATLFSIDPKLSWFGIYQRQQGFSGFIYYFIFFLLVIINIQDKKSLKKLLYSVCFGSAIVSIYGLAQISGWDFVNWDQPVFIDRRIISTLGQPNILASYLLLVIPISAYLFYCARRLVVKTILLIIFLINLIVLYFTYSNSGWIGLLLGAMLCGAFYIFFKKSNSFSKIKKITILMVLTVIIFISLFVLFVSAKHFKTVSAIKASVFIRLDIWSASLNAITMRPWLGYGPENQREVLSKYYKSDWAIRGFINDYPDRAHNIILDILLTTGVLGLVSYFCLWWHIIILLRRALNSQENTGLALAIFTSLVGYLISLFFGFESVTSVVYFWLFFAILIIINLPERDGSISNHQINTNNKKIIFRVLTFILFFVLIFYLINQEINKILADHYSRELKKVYYGKQYYLAYDYYNNIKDLNSNEIYYDIYFGSVLSEWYKNFNAKILKDSAQNIFNNILKANQENNFINYYLRGSIYTALSENKNEYFSLAEINLQEAIKHSTEMPKNYEALASLYCKNDLFDLGVATWEKSLKYVPDIKNPDMNNDHRAYVSYELYKIYRGLGDCVYKQKKYDLALDNYIKASKYNPNDYFLVRKIADLFYLCKDFDQAISYNKRGMMHNPTDYAWPYSIALLYMEKEDRGQATFYAQEAFKIKTDDKNLNNFIVLLNKDTLIGKGKH